MNYNRIEHLFYHERDNSSTLIAVIMWILFLFFIVVGSVIDYPDVITGKISVVSSSPPIAVYTSQPGVLKFLKTNDIKFAKQGDLIAYLDSEVSIKDLTFIDSLLKIVEIGARFDVSKFPKFPKTISLGELSYDYSNFIFALEQLDRFYKENIFELQSNTLGTLIDDHRRAVRIDRDRLDVSGQYLYILENNLRIDSLLNIDKVISDLDMSRSKLAVLNARENSNTLRKSLIASEIQISELFFQRQKIQMDASEKLFALQSNFLSSYNTLRANIERWRLKHLLLAPISGEVRFNDFWHSNMFVLGETAVFSIIPEVNLQYCQMKIPSAGIGKVKVGQEVILKLDDYPFLEYGSVTGYVKDVSIMTRTERNVGFDVQTMDYLISIELPSGLLSSYNIQLSEKATIYGIGEIVVNQRTLFSRLFERIRYSKNI